VAELRLATGPVSWGVDFAGRPENPPWCEVVAGVAAAGFRWMELGPLGFLPPEADAVLAEHGIGVTAGFVFEPLAGHDRLGDVAAGVARRVAAAGGRFLVIIDAVSAAPVDRAALARGATCVAAIARDHGLRPLIHPHAGSHLEREEEWAPLLEHADLCLDTGHVAYAGEDPVDVLRRWRGRIPYLHLKDVDRSRCGGGFWPAVAAGAFVPLGDGDVDLAAVVAELDGFDGWAVIEQDRRPGGDPVADLVRSRVAVEALT
jgi:inosose dehydratase